MKILLLGKNGQVGWELQRSLAVLGDVIALGRLPENGRHGDLTNIDALRQTIRALKPDVIVNAAAYTQVDLAEQQPEQAELVNAVAPRVMADELAGTGGLLVHYSTDYVFDGTGESAWRETDAPNPINQYGRSKLAGEQGIQASGCQHLIFRTSWVYGAHGQNFLKTMLRLGRERKELAVVNDQIGAPTGAELLADVTAHAIRAVAADPGKTGLYHVAAAGETSWHDYACFIFDHVRGLAVERVEPVSSDAWPTPARRPANSRLDTGKFQESFGLRLPDWRGGVARVLDELLDKS